VMSRQKDLQYSSRAASHIVRQKQIHKLRHIISELAGRLPDDVRTSAEVKALASYGCLTRMHVVRLLAPPLQGEDHAKDIDFGLAASSALAVAAMAFVADPVRAEQAPATATAAGVIRLKSVYGFDDTVAPIKADVATKGIKFFDEIDQSQLGAGANIALRPSK